VNMRSGALVVASLVVACVGAGCSPSPWGKAIVTDVGVEVTCVDDTNWKHVCVPSEDFAVIGGVSVGDCLDVRVAREAAEILEVRRSSGCPSTSSN